MASNVGALAFMGAGKAGGTYDMYTYVPYNWKSITAIKNDLIFEIKSPLILQPGPAALGPGLDQICCILDNARDKLRG